MMIECGYIYLTHCFSNGRFHIAPGRITIKNIAGIIATSIINKGTIVDSECQAQAVFIRPGFYIGRIEWRKMLQYTAVFSCPNQSIRFYILHMKMAKQGGL